MRIQVTITMRILVDPDPQHCSISEVRISDRPGVRKWRLATLFNTGSVYFRSSWSPEMMTRNTVQYRKCVFQIVLESGSEDSQPGLILPSGEINWNPLTTVQYRKYVFQIVLESGSEDLQPGLILPSGEINWTLNTVHYRKCAYFRSSWSPEVKTRNTVNTGSVRISDRPGVRKWRLLTLFNTGSAYFRSSWSPEVKTLNTVQYRKCVFQIVLESGSEDAQPGLILPSGEINCTHLTLLNTGSVCISDRPGVRKWLNTGSAYFRSSWSPEVKTRSLAWSCPQGRSTEHLTLFNTGSVRISDRPGVRKWWLAAWPDPALGGDQLELSLPGRHGRRSLRSWF